MSSTTPPGWYPDGQGGQRWWDGVRWAPPAPGPMGTAPLPQQGYPQQGYQQAGYPQQYGQQYGRPPRKGRTGLLIGLAVVAVAVLVVGGIGLVGFRVLAGGGGTGGDDPQAVVERYLEAGRDGDCEAALEYLSESARGDTDCSDYDALVGAGEMGADPADLTYDVGEAEIDGDTATVPVTTDLSDLSGLPDAGTDGLGEVTLDYELVREDGGWYIDDFGAGSLPELPELPELPDAPDLPELDPGDLPSFEPGDIPTS